MTALLVWITIHPAIILLLVARWSAADAAAVDAEDLYHHRDLDLNAGLRAPALAAETAKTLVTTRIDA